MTHCRDGKLTDYEECLTVPDKDLALLDGKIGAKCVGYGNPLGT